MSPTEAEQEKATATMRREARWVRMILIQMFWCLGVAIFVLTHRDPKPYQLLYGSAVVIILLTVLWLGQPVIRWLTVQINLLLLLVMDAADHLLQQYLKHRAIRRRGSLGSPPTRDGSSGSTSPRPDNGSGSE